MLLKRGVGVVAVAALVALMLAVVPDVARAKEGPEAAAHPTNDAATTADAVVVEPGDSLWSISEERLGRDATPRRVAKEVERLWALNRGRIGPDPNIILVGQELSLPPIGEPSATGPSASEAAAKTAPRTREAATRGAAEPARAGSGGRSANGRAADRPSDLNLPKAPAATEVPVARPAVAEAPSSSPVSAFFETARAAATTAATTAASAFAETFAELRAAADGRRLLGWGIVALTLLAGATMARALPMRRASGAREASETWGIPSYGPDSYGPGRRARPGYPGPSDPRGGAPGPGAGAPTTNGGARRGLGLGAVERRRRERTLLGRPRGRRGLPRGGHAAGSYNQDIRRVVLGAAPRSRPRTPTEARADERRQEGGG